MSDYEWFFKKKKKIINYKNLLRNVINIGGEKRKGKSEGIRKGSITH